MVTTDYIYYRIATDVTMCRCYLGYLAIQTRIVSQINFNKGFRMKKLIFALIAAATAVGSAQAQAQAAGPYIGVGITAADHYNLTGATTSSTDGYKANGKIFGGYDLSNTFGVEAGYVDFRNANYAFTTGNSTTVRQAQADGRSFYLAGKGTWPINEQFSLVGKLGATDNKRTLNSATEAAYNVSESKTEVYAGLGVQYKLNQKVSLTAEYERFGKEKQFGVKADAFTIGAKYAF